MAIIIDEKSRVVVQGLTGREGSFHARRNRAYGTKVVAGVTPGKGGQEVDGVPVFDTVRSAVEATGADVSLIFVPQSAAIDAIYEAVDAGLGTIVAITEGIPAHDMLRVYNYLHCRAVTLIGPNCPGVISPGKANVGIMPVADLPARAGRNRQPVRHPHLSSGQRVDVSRNRPVERGRHRRRPRRGIHLCRHPSPLRGRPGDQGDRYGRRDRRRRGRDGGAAYRRADDEAGGGLRRRLHCSRRQADGPRGSYHLGVVGNRPRQEGGDGGGRHACGLDPTDVAELVAEVLATSTPRSR